MNRYPPALRPGLLLCCICLLVVAPLSLRAQASKKAFSDAIVRFLSKQTRPLDGKIANQTERSLSQKAARSAKGKEGIGKIGAHPEIRDETSLIWAAADDATKKRAQMEASALKRDLRAEADRIVNEQKLSSACGNVMTEMLVKTASFCVKQKLITDVWPTEEASAKFVAETLDATTQCIFLGLEHRISRGANANVAKIAARATKEVGKGLGRSAGIGQENPKSESAEDRNESALFGLVHLLCEGD